MHENDTLAAGKAALKRIQRNGKRAIQDWIVVGTTLALGLESVGGDKDLFSKWLQTNFVNLSVGSASSTVSAAMWLATAELDDGDIWFYGISGVSHPVAIRADTKRVKARVEARMREDEEKARAHIGLTDVRTLPKPS